MPKSKRMSPVIGSLPTTPTNSPIRPAIRPFTILPRDTATTQASAIMVSAKNSGGPNLSENVANGPAISIRTIAENVPPMNEASVAQPIARPGCPLMAMGYPSRAVAADCGVPGMLMRMAEIEPP